MMRCMQSDSLIFELNALVWLGNLSKRYGRRVTFDTIPEEAVDDIADQGYTHVWPMGVWERSTRGLQICTSSKQFHRDMKRVLPDYRIDDCAGSAYSIKSYSVATEIGGNSGLAHFRTQLAARGIKLILDFIPNHLGPDHDWLYEDPGCFVMGTKSDLARQPDHYLEIGGRIFARGKDPTFPPWSDVVQLNPLSSHYRRRAKETLRHLTTICDGVRCDMAMLMMSDIFQRTWPQVKPSSSAEFWHDIIKDVRQKRHDFIFIAEAYWDTQRQLLKQGFDVCYDKELLDALISEKAPGIVGHLLSVNEVQSQLLTFIENHDEERAAHHFSPKQHIAAMALVLYLPGPSLIHDGQTQGYTQRIPVHLRRGPKEANRRTLAKVYQRLVALRRKHAGLSGLTHIEPIDRSIIYLTRMTETSVVHLLINYSPTIRHFRFYDPTINNVYDRISRTRRNIQDSALLPWQVILFETQR